MSRFLKIFKRLGLALGILLALALLANGLLIWQTGHALAARLSTLRADGDPLSLPELGARPPVPGADAAAVLKRIEPEVKALSKEMTPITSAAAGVRSISGEDWDLLEAAIGRHPAVLSGLKEASACPGYQSPLNYQASPTPEFLAQMLPYVQLQREHAMILSYQARLQLRKKDYDGAVRTCLVSLRLTRHAENEPMIVAYLVTLATRSVAVGLANEILRSGPVAGNLHEELETELAKHDGAEGFRACLRGERAFGLQAFDEFEQHCGGWLARAYVNDDKCCYLDFLRQWSAEADSSFAAFRTFQKTVRAKYGGFRHKLSMMLLPAVEKVREAIFRSRCQLRCLRALNALLGQKIEAVPANLTVLHLPPEAVLDPYTDQPLIVKRTGGQWVIYGLGTNLKDDGGKFEHLEDVGLGPIVENK